MQSTTDNNDLNNKYNENLKNTSNNPFNYYALFLKESKKSENFYDKYFLRVSDDFSEINNNDSASSGILGFFKSLFPSFSSSFPLQNANKNKNEEYADSLNSIELGGDSYDDESKFLIDRQIKKEKIRRLSESDSLYKIKKHHQNNLNSHYRDLVKAEKSELEQETEKEREYIQLYRSADAKLRLNKLNSISLKELNALIKRNYTLFSNDQKKDLSKINNLYYSIIIANLLGVTILTSFCKAILKYFRILSNRLFLRNFILTAYFSVTVTNNTLLINEHIRKKMIYYPNKIKDKILDLQYEKLKVPYNANMFTYNPEENDKDVFNYL